MKRSIVIDNIVLNILKIRSYLNKGTPESMAILSFADNSTETFFKTGKIPKKGVGWRHIKKKVKLQLDRLDWTKKLQDLRIPPGNHLEKLRNSEFFSIRVNTQWRIIFRWTEKGPKCVEIIDYHN